MTQQQGMSGGPYNMPDMNQYNQQMAYPYAMQGGMPTHPMGITTQGPRRGS